MNQFVDEDSENEEYISGDEEEDEELNVDRKIIKKSMSCIQMTIPMIF